MILWAGLFGHLIDDWGSVSNWECDARFSFCLNASAAQISLLPGPFPMQLLATSVHYVRIQFRSGKLPLHCSQVFWGFYVFHGHANCQFLPAPQWFLTLLPPNRFDIGDFWLQRCGRGLHPVYRKERGMLGYGKIVMIVQVNFEMKSIIRIF